MRFLASLYSIPLALLVCCQSQTNESSSFEPAPAPVGEVQLVEAAPLDMTGFVLQSVPTDDEPLDVIPSIEEVAELTGLETTPERVALGSRLFHDTSLSKDWTVSCATCHDLRFGGVDHLPTAVGIRGQVGPINTPTVFNAALSVAQFWDGRAHDLPEQAAGPPEAAGEMGSSFPEIVGRLQNDPSYVDAFRKAFPDDIESATDIDKDYVLEAIASFEVTLMTPNSAFDRWLQGEADALTAQQVRGYSLFKHVGCNECHYGPGVGGKAFQKLGRKIEYFTGHDLSHADLGRFNVTGDERDRFSFKVPSLRNITATGPYFHSGLVTSLEEAVVLMARHQVGVELDEQQTDDIVSFLTSLTGEYRGQELNGRDN